MLSDTGQPLRYSFVGLIRNDETGEESPARFSFSIDPESNGRMELVKPGREPLILTYARASRAAGVAMIAYYFGGSHRGLPVKPPDVYTMDGKPRDRLIDRVNRRRWKKEREQDQESFAAD